MIVIERALLQCCAILLMIGMSLSAGGIGELGGGYLRAPVGATAFSLGAAQTAAPAYLCSWWNPSGLALIKQRQASLGIGYKPLGRTEGYLSYEFMIPPRVGMSLSALYRGILLIDGLVDDQEYPLDNCAYSTYSFKIGLSYLIRRNFTAGFNVSIFYQSLPTDYTIDGDIIYSSETTLGGLDFGVTYIVNKKLSYGLVIKNILANFSWELEDRYHDLYAVANDTLASSVTLGQEFKTKLMSKPFIWSCDLAAYLFNSHFKPIDHSYCVINNGFEWQRWDMLYIRGGIRDIVLSSDLYRNGSAYKDIFSLAVSLGFSLDLSTALKGKDVKLNYGISTDKVGAGVEQILDFVAGF